MQGQLLTAARPYLQVFSLLTLTLPLSSFGQARYSLRSKCLLAAFACYALVVLLAAFYTTYINIVTLAWEVDKLQVEDFTNALGLVQKVGYSLMLFTSHASLILQYPRLAAIYLEISALEADIATSSQCHGGQRQRYSFRCRLAMRVGLWIILVCICFPQLTIPVMRGMTTPDRMITEFILIVLQFRCFEYTLFVVIVQELLLDSATLCSSCNKSWLPARRGNYLMCSALPCGRINSCWAESGDWWANWRHTSRCPCCCNFSSTASAYCMSSIGPTYRQSTPTTVVATVCA